MPLKGVPPDVFQLRSQVGSGVGVRGDDGDAYERVMGRWSRRLAPLLIRFGGLVDDDRVLDVGSGTGSLSFTLPEVVNVASVAGIDQAAVYVAFARARGSADPRFSFRQADARALPFPAASFDRAFSMLVLQFIPDAERAVAEMCRVVRPGGTVTAAVWDSLRYAASAVVVGYRRRARSVRHAAAIAVPLSECAR